MGFLKALFLDDLIDFLDFWFHHLPRRILRHYFDTLHSFEREFAFKANLRNLTKPLYGDYTVIGYLIAFPYRVIRIILSLLFALFLSFFYLIFILVILLLPIFLISYGVIFSK
jgi:hypothetical protein